MKKQKALAHVLVAESFLPDSYQTRVKLVDFMDLFKRMSVSVE